MYGTNLSHTFKKKKYLSTWIGEQQCMQMDFRQFSRNNMYVTIPRKLSVIHLHAWLISNPCGKVLIIVGISWSPDLRVQLKQIIRGMKKCVKCFSCSYIWEGTFVKGRHFTWKICNPVNCIGYVRTRKLNKTTAAHFNQPGHSTSNMKFTVLEKVKSLDPLYGREREKLLIRKFYTFDRGLNKTP